MTEGDYWYNRASQDKIYADLQHEAAMIALNSLAERKQLGEWQLCPKCNGEGTVTEQTASTFIATITRTCPVCNGAKVLARPIINDKNV
jgi:DnaJ-class molecular chaperone